MKKNLLIIVLVVAMAMTLVACGGEKAPAAPAYTDGTYEGTGSGLGGDIVVSVEVKDGKIASVDVVSHAETEGISDPAFDTVPDSIVSKNSTEVEIVSGATMTSDGIIEAVNDALSKAK